jgi:hypothetical protein
MSVNGVGIPAEVRLAKRGHRLFLVTKLARPSHARAMPQRSPCLPENTSHHSHIRSDHVLIDKHSCDSPANDHLRRERSPQPDLTPHLAPVMRSASQRPHRTFTVETRAGLAPAAVNWNLDRLLGLWRAVSLRQARSHRHSACARVPGQNADGNETGTGRIGAHRRIWPRARFGHSLVCGLCHCRSARSDAADVHAPACQSRCNPFFGFHWRWPR